MAIIIDQDFKNLIPPLSDDEFKQLEQNCVDEGIRDSLVVWKDGNNQILIDGHNRFVIASKHGLEFDTEEKKFDNRDDVVLWIIKNQLGRRNLSKYDRSILALRLKPVIAERAKERKKGGQGGVLLSQKSDKANHVNTDKELGKIAGVSHDTIHKVETIENSGNEAIKRQVQAGKLSINQGYNAVKPKPKPHDFVKQAEKEHKEFQEKQDSNVVSMTDIKADKDNREIIKNAVMQRVLKLFNNILDFGNSNKDNVTGIADTCTHDEKMIILQQCVACKSVIEMIQKEFSGEDI